MMLNMDPPLHTRYRRLVNKGFTPRMVRDLEAEHPPLRRRHHRPGRSRRAEADFVTDLSAELPLQVIAELLGVPQDDRHRMFEWSNRMVGNEDPEYQGQAELALTAAMELYAYASELYGKKRIDPHADLMSVLTTVEVDGRAAERPGARAVLPPAHRRRQRDDPQPHVGRHARLLPAPRPVAAPARRPQPAPHRRRRDAALRHPGHELPPHRHAATSS